MREKDELPTTEYLRQREIVPGLVPVSPATFRRMVRDGRFPAPVKFSTRVRRWHAAEVRAWVESRTAQVSA